MIVATLLVVAALFGGVLAVWLLGLDPDPGHYRDGWRTRAPFPDKLCHLLAAYALALSGCAVGAQPVVAAVAVIVAGALYEVAQAHPRGGPRGFGSWRDAVADAAGALAALALWLAAH